MTGNSVCHRRASSRAPDFDDQFVFSSACGRDYLMVDSSIEVQPSIMGNHRSRTWRTCRSQQRHRASDIPVRSRILLAPRFLPSERRYSGRVQSAGTAIVHGPFAAHGRIIDLGIGGLSLLVADSAAVPEVGVQVRLDVRLDGLGRWLHLIGSVVRVDAHGSAVALGIELLVVPPEFEDLVQDELLSALDSHADELRDFLRETYPRAPLGGMA